MTLEESVYRSGHKNNYFADRFGIDVLTDTTERSPTYCSPPFRKFDDTTATESWAFLFLPYPDTPQAWERIIKRQPKCVEWSEQEVRALVSEDKAARTDDIVRKISAAELMRFKVGLDGLKYRPLGKGDCAVGIVSEEEQASLLSAGRLSSHGNSRPRGKPGRRSALSIFGREESHKEIRDFLATWNPDGVAVLVPVPQTDFLLDGVTRAGLKMLLNALSTCTMVRLGRVMGNYMIWVVPSNLKLIDRSTRYIQTAHRPRLPGRQPAALRGHRICRAAHEGRSGLSAGRRGFGDARPPRVGQRRSGKAAAGGVVSWAYTAAPRFANLQFAMTLDDFLLEAEDKMSKTEQVVVNEFAGVRTGKASPALVENLLVEVYGSQMRIRELAGITTPEPRTLTIQPWDANSLHPIEKAILKSNLGLTPSIQGQGHSHFLPGA